jgi:SRSO17 transposase
MAMIEVKIAEHLIDKTFRSGPGGQEIAVISWTLKPEVDEWLNERLNRQIESYLTGDKVGNWYYAINFRPEESTTAVEFKIRWS